MKIKFENGRPSLPGAAIADLLLDAEKRVPNELEARVGSELIAKIKKRPEYLSEDVAWPVLRAVYELGLFSLVPENGLPCVSYQLSNDVNLDGAPWGAFAELYSLKPKMMPTEIAGHTVDFPLGLPASIIAQNSSYLAYYAARGFSILTYKTVRSKPHPSHSHPQWVFLEGVERRLSTRELDEAIFKGAADYGSFLEPYSGRQRYFPEDRSISSMANSFGVPSHGPEFWMDDVQKTSNSIKDGQVLIVSVQATVDTSDELIPDFVRTAEMAREAGAQIIELNFSCPNTNQEKVGELYYYPEDVRGVASAVRKAVDVPIFAKIGYLPDEKIKEFVHVTRGEINGIVAINTVSAKVNNGRDEPAFPGRISWNAGISGWAVKEVANETAKNLVKHRAELGLENDLCLLGLGGVMSEQDFQERLETGVNAVEICTGAFADPLLGLRIRCADGLADDQRLSPRETSYGKIKVDRPIDEPGGEAARPKGELDAAAHRSAAMTEAQASERIEFQGTIVRVDSDGFGVVKLDDSPQYGTFTRTTLQSKKLPLVAKKGRRVRGTAVKSGDALRILELSKE